MRLEQIEGWIENGYPRVYWLAGFTYPSCFLTAVLQTTARKNAIPIDTLSFEYSIMDAPEEKIGPQPKEGVYIKDMYLEGAGWNFDDQCLCEPNPMELIVNMPIVHFKPSDAKKKRNPAEIYQCPLYMYPVRTGCASDRRSWCSWTSRLATATRISGSSAARCCWRSRRNTQMQNIYRFHSPEQVHTAPFCNIRRRRLIVSSFTSGATSSSHSSLAQALHPRSLDRFVILRVDDPVL